MLSPPLCSFPAPSVCRCRMYPYCIQLDALLATVNVIQEMLLCVRGNRLEILPACPDLLKKGEVKNWCYPKGEISFCWDSEKGECKATLVAEREGEVFVTCPLFRAQKEYKIFLKSGDRVVLS